LVHNTTKTKQILTNGIRRYLHMYFYPFLHQMCMQKWDMKGGNPPRDTHQALLKSPPFRLMSTRAPIILPVRLQTNKGVAHLKRSVYEVQ